MLEGQAAVVIAHWMTRFLGWVVALLDELVLLEFLAVKTGIVYRRVG